MSVGRNSDKMCWGWSKISQQLYNQMKRLKECFVSAVKIAACCKQYIEGRNVTVSHAEAMRILEEYSPNPKSSAYRESCRIADTFQYDLSIIIPTYNNGAFLDECLQSVLNQKTNFNYQIIVINDGATDNTDKILQKYSENQKVTVFAQKNQGVSVARNKGIDLAQGSYLMFVDSDDRLTDGAVETLMFTALEKDADVVAGNYYSVSYNGKTKRKASMYKDGVINPEGNLHGQLWAKVYKCQLFNNLCFPSGYWFEDSIFAQIVWPLALNVYTVSEYVYEYRTNPHGISRSSLVKYKVLDSLYITETLLNDKKRFGLELNENAFRYFLRMVVLTQSRTTLLNGKIAKCIFVVQCQLYKRFEGIEICEYADIQEALKEKDYSKYISAIIARKKKGSLVS